MGLSNGFEDVMRTAALDATVPRVTGAATASHSSSDECTEIVSLVAQLSMSELSKSKSERECTSLRNPPTCSPENSLVPDTPIAPRLAPFWPDVLVGRSHSALEYQSEDTQQLLVFLLKMTILGSFGGTTILGNTHIWNPMEKHGICWMSIA